MKHYLIDSENVGDFWIPLLELPAQETELIVFYTKNSPHMSYDSLIKLKQSDRTVIFIKCYEGTNALDFQLCSELGYRIAMNEDDDFIIVTNDTGYDAAVKYWRHKNYSVKRIAGKDSRTGSRRRGNLGRYDVAAEVSALLHVQANEPEMKSAAQTAAAEESAGPEASRRRIALSAPYSGSEMDLADGILTSDESDISFEDDEETGDTAEDTVLRSEEDYESAASGSDEPDYEESDEYVYEESDEPEYEESDEPEYEESDEPEYEESDEPDYEDSDEEEYEESDGSLYDEAREEEYEDSEGSLHDESDAPLSEDSDEPSYDGTADGSDESDSGETGGQGDHGSRDDNSGDHMPDASAEQDSPKEEYSDSSAGGEIHGKEDAAGEGEEPFEQGGEPFPAQDPSEPAQESDPAQATESGEEMSARGEGEEPQAAESDGEEDQEGKNAPDPDPEEITAIVSCIAPDNLAELHNQLIQFYGDDGKDIYQQIKSGALSIERQDWSKEEKFLYYSALIFRHSDEPAQALEEENIREFAQFLLSAENKRRNLNSLRYALLKHYGKDKGRRYYFLIKPYVKAFNQM